MAETTRSRIPPSGCTTLWRFAGDGEALSFAMTSDGKAIFVVDDHGALYKLDSSGAVLWRTRFGAAPIQVTSTSDGRYVCLLSRDGFLRFVIQDGREYWRVREMVENPFVTILASRKQVALGGETEVLKLYDYFGDDAGEARLECRAHFVLEMGREGDFLVASEYGFIERCNRNDMRLWRVVVPSGIGKPSATADGDMVVAPGALSGLVRIDGAGAGAEKFELPGPATCACTDGAGRNLFAVASQRELIVTNRAGVVAFRKMLPSPVRDIAASWSGHRLGVLYESGVLEVFGVGAYGAEPATFYELSDRSPPTTVVPLRPHWCRNVFPRIGAVRSGQMVTSGSGREDESI